MIIPQLQKDSVEETLFLGDIAKDPIKDRIKFDEKYYPILKKYFSRKYVFVNKAWYHLEYRTRHLKESEQKLFVLPFYRLLSHDAMIYHIVSFCRFDLTDPLYYKYIPGKPKPNFYFPFWKKPGKFNTYNPGKYNKYSYFRGSKIKSILQFKDDFNGIPENISKDLSLLNGHFIDLHLTLYHKNCKWLLEGRIIRETSSKKAYNITL